MLLFANNADSTLRLPVLATDVTIYLAAGTGTRFPTVTPGDSFFVTLIDSLGNVEIVECTGRAGDALTVVRGRDGTTAKAFPAGAIVDHRIVAEVLRRLSVESLMGEPDGVATLDGDGLVPMTQLPSALLTQTEGDARYPRLTTANVANGYAALNSSGLIPMSILPSELLTLTEGDAAYVKLSQKGAANGVASLDASGKIQASQFDISIIDLSPYAPKINPNFTSGLTAGGTATLNNVTVSGSAQFAGLAADAVTTSGTVTIKGGSPYGKRTLSTSAPSGTPAAGDEWIQHEA